jgi:hypothetical protein
MTLSSPSSLARIVSLVLALVAIGVPAARAADPAPPAHNVVLITTDGLRWEEVFRGAEEILLSREYGGVADTNALRKSFWRPTAEERRAALFPFLWGTVAHHGQLWGNRDRGSDVRLANSIHVSYPGYNEFLTGYPDPAITNNSPTLNANTNVLEWLHSRPGFRDRVAATVNWGLLPWILNGPRAAFPIWSGFDVPEGTRRLPVPGLPEDLLAPARIVWPDVLSDTFAGFAARHALRTLHPRVLYVSLGETDDWAHEGRYDRHLRAAHEFDRFLAGLWDLVQSLPDYRDRTAFLIAVDHGRGPAPLAWKDHNRALPNSAYIWFAALGPGIAPLGERANTAPVRQAQIAATVAALVGEDFRAACPNAAPPIRELLQPPP